MNNSSEDSLLLFISPLSATIEIFHYRFVDYTKGASPEAGPHVRSSLSDTTESLVHDRGLIECGASYQMLTLDTRFSRWATVRNRDVFGTRYLGNICLIVKELYSCKLRRCILADLFPSSRISISGFRSDEDNVTFILLISIPCRGSLKPD